MAKQWASNFACPHYSDCEFVHGLIVNVLSQQRFVTYSLQTGFMRNELRHHDAVSIKESQKILCTRYVVLSGVVMTDNK